MIVHADPTPHQYKQTIVSLGFACRAKAIKNTLRCSIDFDDDDGTSEGRLRLIQSMKEQLALQSAQLLAAQAEAERCKQFMQVSTWLYHRVPKLLDPLKKDYGFCDLSVREKDWQARPLSACTTH